MAQPHPPRHTLLKSLFGSILAASPSRTSDSAALAHYLSYLPVKGTGRLDNMYGRPGEVEELLSLIQTAYERAAITSTNLYFSTVSSMSRRADGSVLTLEERKVLFATLLTVIVNKGCETLYVTGGKATIQQPPHRKSSNWGSDGLSALQRGAKATLTVFKPQRILDLPPIEAGPSDRDRPTTLTTEPHNARPFCALPKGVIELEPLQSNLKSVRLRESNILLAQPLLEWTSTLLNCSSSLHTLAIWFHAPSLPADTTWSTLFRSVTLPSLTNLFIDSGTEFAYPFPHADFVSFLAMHPKIVRLKLDVLEPREAVEEMRKLTLPALEVFSGHPSSAAWIASELLPAGAPRLRTFVTKTSGVLWQRPSHSREHRHACDEALVKLSATTSSGGRGDFVLGLDCRNRSLNEMIGFLSYHSESWPTLPANVASRLHGVRTLKILFPANSASYSIEVLLFLLARFINTFPDVERFEGVGILSPPGSSHTVASREPEPPQDVYKTTREFLHARCAKLKSIQLTRWELDYFDSFDIGSPTDGTREEGGSELQSHGVSGEPGPPLAESSDISTRVIEPGPPE